MKKSILVSSFFLVVIVCFLWLVFKPIDKKTNNQEDLKPDQAAALNIGSIKPNSGFILPCPLFLLLPSLTRDKAFKTEYNQTETVPYKNTH